MNKEEFNLSEKIRNQPEGDIEEFGSINVEDVKEFIRLLKEQYKEFGDIRDFIDKLSGDKLK